MVFVHTPIKNANQEFLYGEIGRICNRGRKKSYYAERIDENHIQEFYIFKDAMLVVNVDDRNSKSPRVTDVKFGGRFNTVGDIMNKLDLEKMMGGEE